MNGDYNHLLIPSLAVALALLSIPPIIRYNGNYNGKGGRRCYYRSGLLCDIWNVLSSVVIIIVWATCELHFDGSSVLSSAASATAEAANGGEECSDLETCTDATADRNRGENRHQHEQQNDFPSLDQVSDAITYHCYMASLILGTAMVLELLQVLAHCAVSRRYREEAKEVEARDQQQLHRQNSTGSNNTHNNNTHNNNSGSNSGSYNNNNNTGKQLQLNPNSNYHTIYTLYGLHDSECLLLVYALLFFTHLLMSNDRAGETFGFLFAEPLAAAAGYYRPVSTARYIEWSIASPLLMSLIGRAIPRLEKEDVSPAERSREISDTLRPALIVTVSYIFLAWLALLVIEPHWRWILIFFSFMGWLLSVADQLTAWKVGADHSVASAQAADMLLFIQIVVYFLYGVVFLLPLFDLLDPISEQAALTYADATIKLTCSASLAAMRHADSLAEAKRERKKSDSIASDLREIIHDANAPIFALDADGNIILWNEKLAKLTGATLPDILGKPLENYLSKECRDEFREIFEARKAGKAGTEQYHCDMITDRKEDGHDDDSHHSNEGRLVSLLMTATARHDTEGNFIGIIGVGTDLTEVTRIKAIEEKKNEFMAVVSHELKSPLHGIVGLAESLAQSEKSVDRKNQLKMVKNCAFRLIDLVSNIMQMSRLSRDRDIEDDNRSTTSSKGSLKELRNDPVDIPSIINEVCMLVTNATDKGNRPILNPLVRFENKVPMNARLPIFKGDAYKITQVFYNIITNACKFCSEGSITIDASVNTAKNRLEVSVMDTGVGINPANVKRIFEPFEQETNSSRRSFGGIGLGLAISKEVIELHKGNIYVVSTPGKGSKFVVSLPVTEDEIALASVTSFEGGPSPENRMIVTTKSTASLARMSRRGSDSSKLTSSGKSSSDGERVLILSVDDDIVNQEVIKSALSDHYDIHVAMNGFEALEFFSTRSKLPDLVLLDVMMPGMDGFEVLKEIRDEKQIPPTSLPIIMLSAMEPVDKALIQSLNSGANDYVSKPFDPDILKARVSTAVEIKRLRQIENESFHHSKLLHDILPFHIVERLIMGDRSISERHDSVCMLFGDIVGWTPMSESVPTHKLLDMLNQLFSEFDALTEKHGVYKADTIGDAYIVAAGHEGHTGPSDATLRVTEFAIDMLEKAKTIRPPNGMQLQMRVGIHTGPAYSGVVGTKIPKYTFFGDTVNTAARMEQTGVPNCINMSSSSRKALVSELAACRSGRTLEGWLGPLGSSIIRRDPINVKGKGAMELFLLCPKGVSSQVARRLSNMQGMRSSFTASVAGSARNGSFASISSLEEAGDAKMREAKLKSEVAMLKKDLKRLETSKQEAWAEVEILRLNLAESELMPKDDMMAKELSLSRKSSLTTSSSQPSRQDLTPHQVEELKLQLLVTTNSLMRARKALLEKDEEIDAMELRLQRVKADLQGRAGDDSLTRSITSASVRSSFMARTRDLLDASSSPASKPIVTMPVPRRRYSSRLSSLEVQSEHDDDFDLHDDYDDEGITTRRK